MNVKFEETDDGYSYGYNKIDRHGDGYLAGVTTPAKYNYTGLFTTPQRALQWCRHIVARDRRTPLIPASL